MGKLLYGPSVEIIFDDRVLAHLQLAMGQKLRRHEGFFFSWKDETVVGDGRSTLWIETSIPLVFRYNGGRMPAINRDWLEVLVRSSNSPQGLQLTDESAVHGTPDAK
ncbi:MAG TPA: ATP-dependent DNA ligase [Lacisediminihabitans sp.]|uniref:DUF7882 family protein n=1 Tax=Lacisediminihabitans sp. TaxID=2787631 RepID=UPI002EDAE50F